MTDLLIRLYSLNTFLLAFLIVGPVVGVTVGATLLTRKWVHARWAGSHEVIGPVFAAIGTIYAVILAMIAVAAWENFNEMDDLCTQEASEALNVFRDSLGLPRPFSTRVRGLMEKYVATVIESEWPAMNRGEPTRATDPIIDAILVEFSFHRPTEPGEAVMFQEAFETMNRVLAHRRRRLMAIDMGLLTELWIVVLVGGVLNLGLSLLITTKDVRLDLILSVSFSLMIGLLIFLIFAMDHPFLGSVSVKPDAFVYARDNMIRLRAQEASAGTPPALPGARP